MTTYIAFLRGINVGTHNRMKMAELRGLCESLGYENVETYIASGNVIFETQETNTNALADDLSDGIADKFGYDITVMIRTAEELAAILDSQPFDEPAAEENVKRYVTFLADEPGDEQVEQLLATGTEAEEFAVNSRVVYSRIDKDMLENGRFTDAGKLLGVVATRRAWNVVTKVLEVVSD